MERIERTNFVTRSARDILRSPLLYFAAVFFAAASVAAAVDFLGYLHQDAITELLYALFKRGIFDSAARKAWVVIYICLDALCIVLPAIVSAGIWLTVSSRDGLSSRGCKFLIAACKVLLRAIYCFCAVLAVIFVYKSVAYIAKSIPDDMNVMLISSMIFSEGLMGATAAIIFAAIIVFLRKADVSLVSFQYTILTGKADPRSISLYAAIFLCILAFFCGRTALNNMGNVFTLVKYLSIALGSLILAWYVYRCKIHMERLLYAEERGQ